MGYNEQKSKVRLFTNPSILMALRFIDFKNRRTAACDEPFGRELKVEPPSSTCSGAESVEGNRVEFRRVDSLCSVSILN